MYKFKSFLVMLAIFGLSIGAANAQTHPALGGGTGTSSNPYQIATPAHLKTLADFVNAGKVNGDATAGVYYKVINDLDLTAYAAGTGWNPIGYYNSSTDNSYFKGNFNGNGKKVTNLKINRPTEFYLGLFGSIYGATIKGLGIENCDIAGYSIIGGLVGNNSSSSTISNCYVTGNVIGPGAVGGLVGVNEESSSISNCYATAKISGASYGGGLVGYNNYSTISNCYATGKVSGTGDVGGLVGDNASSSTIKNCVAANDSVVSTANTTSINRICGTPYGTFQNNYALSTMAVKNSSGNVPIIQGLNTNAGMSKSMSDFQNLYFYSTAGNWNTAAWDINDPNGVWKICPEGGMMPVLRWQNGICFVPVDAITGLPTTAMINTMLTLSGTVEPSNATNKTIVWSLLSAGTTNAVLSGNTFFASAAGVAFLSAKIINGAAIGTDYIQNFIITVGTTGIDDVKTENLKIYVANGELIIENGEWRINKVEIFDLSGKIILNSHSSFLIPINVSHLPQGIYFVKIKTDEGIITKKFIKK